MVAHGIEIVGGGTVIRRLQAVMYVGVGVGAGTRFGKAEMVHQLCHRRSHATGDHMAAFTFDILGTIVIVLASLSPVGTEERLDGSLCTKIVTA